MENEILAKFSEKISRTLTVTSFRFIAEVPVTFLAGQYLQIIFDRENRNNRDLNKYLSFSSGPGLPYFEVTKRLSSSQFSEKLRGLRAGDPVFFKLPLGKCVLDDNSTKIGFLVGGIGITPVISMLSDLVTRSLPKNVIIFYANRTEEEIIFKPELDTWTDNNQNIRMIYSVSDCQPRDVRCHFGRINNELIAGRAADYRERKWYIFGPPAMVDAMSGLLKGMGQPQDLIVTEKFLGY